MGSQGPIAWGGGSGGGGGGGGSLIPYLPFHATLRAPSTSPPEVLSYPCQFLLWGVLSLGQLRVPPAFGKHTKQNAEASLALGKVSLLDLRNSPFLSLGISPEMAEQVVRWDRVEESLGLSPGTEQGEGVWTVVAVPSGIIGASVSWSRLCACAFRWSAHAETSLSGCNCSMAVP